MDDDKWIKDLERKMEGFEMSPPDGLWTDIERRLAQRGGQGTHNPARHGTTSMSRRVSIHRRGVWMAAAVFVACLVVGSSVWLGTRQPDTPVTYTELATVPKPSQQTSPVDTEPTVSVSDDASAFHTDPVATVRNTAKVDVASASVDDGDEVLDGKKTVAVDREPADTTVQQTPQSVQPQSGRPDRRKRICNAGSWDCSILASNRSGEKGLSVSIVAQGVMNSSMQRAGYDELLDGSIWQSGSDDGAKGDGDESDEYGALEEVIVGNDDRPVYTRKSHKQPVRIGVSASWNLGMGWSVGTGLTYSYLSSDLVSGTAESNYSTHQKLHYVGVPLNIGYTFFSHRRLSLYGTVGGMVEKCVKGESTTVFSVYGKEETPQYDEVNESRLQYSANAALGVRLDIADHVGFYLEPGVSYHFDNHSGVTNIYKDTPLNFSLGLGFRYSF